MLFPKEASGQRVNKLGIYVAVNSAIEATQYLLRCGVRMVLTNKYCQDPLEEHFGRHRALGVRAENPSLWTYG